MAADASFAPQPQPRPTGCTTPPRSGTPTSTATARSKTGVADAEERYRLVDEICAEKNLYKILGVEKNATNEELRRAYISRSRICHPDKFQEYPEATRAFQQLAYAYETLNKSSTRRAYDMSGKSNLNGGSGPTGDETLHGVLYQLFLEFMDGDFETIRALLAMLSETNPNFNLADESIENLHKAFLQMRDLLLASQKYLYVIQFELMRLYELQYQLRALSYFDIFGRLRLTMQMARLTLSIPLHIDSVMKDEAAAQIGESKKLNAKAPKKGLLGEGTANLIAGLVLLLESGERYV